MLAEIQEQIPIDTSERHLETRKDHKDTFDRISNQVLVSALPSNQ